MNRWTSKFRFLGRGAWAIAIAGLAGGCIAYLLVPVLPTPDNRGEAKIEVRLLGQALPLDDHGMQAAAERVRRYAATSIHLVIPDGKTKELSLGRLGAQIDKLHLTSLVRDSRDPTSLMRRTHAQKAGQSRLELPVPIVLEPNEALRELMRVKDEVDRVPTDARMDLERRELLPEVPGRLLDIDRTFLAIEQAVTRGIQKVEAVVIPLRPRRIASELTDVKFSHVLGYFETRYDRSDKARERTYNLRLAASKLDGHVLLPGEAFDFNEVVGPRDETNGYRIAPVIAEGELVDGIGGGTCKISGTLHGAVFFSGLDILERVPHTRPSSYIKMGLDATVVYPTINFRFKNSFDFPVVLHETVKDGVVRAEILGPERKHAVTLIRRITEALPYEQLEREDDRLPRGVRVLSQRGVAGFAITRYRIVREQHHATRERWLDKYPPTPQIIRVGTGDMPKDSVEATDDAHPEYLADELLVMTQTSDVTDLGEQAPLDGSDDAANSGAAKPSNSKSDDRSSNLFESRQAGWTGVAGWTKEQKMPQWEPDERNSINREKRRTEKSLDNSTRTAEPNGSKIKAATRDGTKDGTSKKPGRSNRE